MKTAGGYPLQHQVMVAPRSVKVNAFGDEIETVGEEQPVFVFGWYLSGGSEGRDGHIYSVEWDAVVFSPPGVISPGDRVRLPQVGVFTVLGAPGWWDHNPWWSPGLVEVKLKKVGEADG